VEAEELGGKDLKAAVHRRTKTLKATQADFESLQRKYGNAFSRQWMKTDLFSRAKAHGLEKEYSYYRLTSSVLHGSAGGVLGLQRTIGGATVDRVGPAFAVCPIALLQGIRFFDKIINATGGTAGQPAKDLKVALKQLRDLWPRYRGSILRLDEEVWPREAPLGGAAFFAILPITGKEQWYFYNGATHELYEADPPAEISVQVKRALRYFREKILREAGAGTDWIAMSVEGVHVEPRPDAKPMEPERVLARKPLGGWKGFPTPDSPLLLPFDPKEKDRG
jgi:hypothetical protein